ncbi:hypothetical protein OROGR_023072 [Orobanche gracilis]
MARILVFKIRPSQEILKIRDGTPFEAEEILIYRKKARILVFKIRPSQENLKIRDGTPLEFSSKPSQEILKIRDGRKEWHGFWFLKLGHLKKFSKFMMVPLWRRKKFRHTKKSPRNGSVWHFSSKLDVPSNVLQKKRVARILVFKIRPSQEILKIRDGTPLERVARILVFKIRPSQEILKIRDGTPLEMPSQEILKIRDGTPLENKRVARILVFKIKPSQEILKIRDGIKEARILVFKIRPSQENLKIRDVF